MVLRRASGVLVAVVGLALAGLLFTGCQAPGSVLRGKVTTTTGTHVAGVVVSVYSNNAQTVVTQTTTDSDGDYSFSPAALPDGTYRLLFGTDHWWSNQSDWLFATPVAVSEAAPVVIDATVNVVTGSVSGTVTNTTTSAPASGVKVAALSTISGSTVATTTTAGDGTYAFGSLPAGDYLFVFTGPGLTTRYNNSALTKATAPVITVAGGSATAGVDTTVATDATITGTVTNGTSGESGIVVGAFDPTSGQVLGGAVTASDGTFTIAGLDNTAYTVAVADFTGQFQPLVYGSNSNDPTTGTQVTPVGATIDIGTVTLTPVTLPGAPTGVTAIPGDGQATVSWIAPTTDGGRQITSYTVTASTGQTCTTSGGLSCVVTGLTNGSPTTVTVTATNTVGISAPSAPPTPVTAAAASWQSLTPSQGLGGWTATAVNDSGSVVGYTDSGQGVACTSPCANPTLLTSPLDGFCSTRPVTPM